MFSLGDLSNGRSGGLTTLHKSEEEEKKIY